MKYVFKKSSYKLAALIFDTMGEILFFPGRLFRKNIPNDPKNILIVRLDHIGDFVCTTPLFKNLKKRFPSARITVLVNSVSKELAYRDPRIDKVITFSPFYLSRKDRSSPFMGLMRVIKDVRAIGFDLGIDPRGDILSIIIMWLGGIKHRIGYGITGGGFLLHKEGRYDKSAHIIDRNLVLLWDIGVDAQDRLPEVHFNEKDIEAVEGLIMQKGVRPINRAIGALGQTLFSARNDVFVVLHPFAGAKAKEWPRDNFQKLIDRLKKDGREVLIVGNASDQGEFANVVDLRGKLNLPQLTCLIKQARLFIGLDSGPANIAAALNVPSVIICSGTNRPELWIPNNSNVKFVQKKVECKPCENKVCPKASHECMELISVEDVMNEIAKLCHPEPEGRRI